MAPDDLLEALKQFATKEPDSSNGEDFSYQLISKRQVETHNSWTHNIPDFLTRLENQNFLYMHPQDAERENFTEDQLIDVKTASATIRLALRFTKDLSRGVVAIPHGWGHQNSGQSRASTATGVNVNLLARSGPTHIDPISGMSQLTGFRVSLSAAEQDTQPQDVKHDWSGLPSTG